ncbi:putative disease resistance protein RGA1 [Iris pallida]|uniref:Disease resistance protein RGA1 n=1 Tax=Iris pallida TaxID=29817 RepID=A0AAX6HCR7_IRIPA|nr:putative disease resistance protein RGA1 [Iris pallida]
MEKIALSLVGPIVSPIFSKLENAALSYFGGDITEEELQHLQNIILPKIKAVLLVAEAKNVKDLQPCMVTLKEAAYEAEDVLDMYEYRRLKAQVSSTHKYFKTLKKTARAVFAPFTLKTGLKKSIEKLNKIAAEIDGLNPIISNFPNQDPMNRQQPTVSSPTSLVIGRDHERDSIVNMLISAAKEPTTSSERRIPVLAIYGMGGAGKTTLAQSINKDPRVEKHFDTKMWVHVPRKFDAHAITKKIIESISKGECPSVEEFDALQLILKDKLKSKKFLLVLDDVWCSDKETNKETVWHLDKGTWDQMLIPFNEVGEMESRILITCRAEEVTSKLGVDHSFSLAELEDDDYWSIFKHYAFGDAKEAITDPKLSELASKIVKKLSKSPLAARMVGSSLRGRNVEYWKQTLQRGDMLKDTLGALYWSFEMLPPCLQRCFALCSLYPKGYHIEKVEDFVRLWIAQGFVEVPSNSTVTLEDEARSYFNELLSNSFFQKKSDLYEMHDLLHDLAEKVSKDYCFRIEDDCQGIPPNVMHLSVLDGDKDISSHLPNILKLVNLRTLIIFYSWYIEQDDMFGGFIRQVFMKFKKLRMLHLGGGRYSKVIKLDKSVGGLKHLRYLQMEGVEELPESLGKLYHLQFLVINISIKKQFGIGQLKNLQQLRGTLCIDGLENVKDKAEASEALLKEKKHVDRLELHWERQSLERDGSRDAEVLEGLQPHPNLGALKLGGYNGVRLPIDLGRLHSLEIVDCRNLQQIPSLPGMLGRLVIRRCENLSEVPLLLGPNLTGLEDVTIEGCENLRSIGNSLVYSSSLKSLYITNCPRLTVQQQQQADDHHRGGGVIEFLNVEGCPELTWLWNLNCFTSVRRLRVKGCPKLTLIKSGGGGGGDDSLSPMPSSSSSSSSPLESVTIDDLSLLTAALLPPRRRESIYRLDSLWKLTIEDSTKDEKPFTAEQEELFQHHLTSLTYLSCEGLPSLPANLENLSSLKDLRIWGCPKIESLPNLPASLRELRIQGCPKIESLPNLPASLRVLYINGCPKIESLPNLPASLRELRIQGCPKIESLPNLPASLRVLYINGCPKIESLPNLPASLRELRIQGCPKIESLPNLPASLRVLYINGCPKIESLPNLPASLRELRIRGCPKIESLPNLPASLRELRIRGCPKIESLPNLPASLETVAIGGGFHPRLKEKYGNDEKFYFGG